MSKIPDKTPPAPPVKQEQQSSLVARGIRFEGPLPPPAVLEGYEQIVPGAAERLIALVEADAKHQRDLEFATINAETNGLRRGQILGAIVVLAALGVAAFCAYLGHETSALTIGGTTVISLATAFVLGRRTDTAKEETQKKK